jgi:hypothetical protein
VPGVVQVETTMSESEIAWRAGVGAEGMEIPASEACASASALAPAAVKTRAGDSLSLLKRVVSFPAMLGTMLVGAVFIAGRTFAVDPDLWWHVKNGQNILATHRWPTTDPFSFTVAGQPWISTEWLGDVLFAAVARLAGLQGLDALLIILGGAVMVALYAYGTLRSGNSKAGFVAAATLLVLANASFSLRPQMLGYVFLIITLIVLEQFRRGESKWLWFLPVLLLLWVNAHGSFVIGMLAIAAYWLEGLVQFRVGGIEARRWTPAQRIRLEIIFLLCLIALTITPYGTQLALYPFHVASSLPIGVANVMEWQPMPFNIVGGKFFLALLLGFMIVQIAFRFTWRLEELALFLFGTMMACLHVRFVLLFVPFFAPLLATILARWVPTYNRAKDQYILNAVLMTAAAVAIVWYFPSRAEMQQTVARRFPVRAVEYMQQHAIAGPMLNSYGFGGYLIWKGQRVFVDGRADPYERGGSLADYFHITHLQPGALVVLRGYGIESCLLERDEPLATMLAALPEWQRVYADNLSVLFVKRNATTSANAMRGSATLGQKE